MSFDPRHEEYLAALPDFDPQFQRLERSPRGKQRLGWFTVMCLILNRSIGSIHPEIYERRAQRILTSFPIGSGVFATPSKIILSTGNVGPSLVLWVIGGVVALAGLYTWTELGLSVPRRVDPESREEKSVPCNGGEKNFVQHPLSSASRNQIQLTCRMAAVRIPFPIAKIHDHMHVWCCLHSTWKLDWQCDSAGNLHHERGWL
jgi:hypothetical protein